MHAISEDKAAALVRIKPGEDRKAEIAVCITNFASGEPVYNEMCRRLKVDLDPKTPEPADANESIWIVIASAHGAQPRIDLLDGKLPQTGVTRKQAIDEAFKFSREWDSLCGGVANVVRLSDLTPTSVELWANP